DETLEETFDDEEMNELEDEIQSAVSELSDEELEENVDEDMLLDIVSNDEAMANFSGLDDLDEQSLKIAVGEAEASDIELLDKSDDLGIEDEILEEEVVIPNEVQNSKVEGVEALKTLLKALENDDVAKSLKGMNININISFGDDN
ncbi:MAG: DNA topoisomerase IV, partial [Campylobacterota bacterium]|nr:DNA topoisomerase IV [Campylobacterota bacterium]